MRIIKSLLLLILLNSIFNVNGQDPTVDPTTIYNQYQLSGGQNNSCDPSNSGSPTATLVVDLEKCVIGCGGSVKIVSDGTKNSFSFQPYTDNSCANINGAALTFTCTDAEEKTIGTSAYRVRCGTAKENDTVTAPPVTTVPATTTPAATKTPPPVTSSPSPTPSDSSAYSITASVSLIVFSIFASFL